MGNERFHRAAPWVLPVALLAWTAVSWGGRVGLLTDVESTEFTTWVRVGGSIVVGIVTAWSAWRRPAWHRVAATVFVGWTVLVWGRALLVNWTAPPSLAFALVHTLLAFVWFGLAWWVWATRTPDRAATRPAAHVS